MNVMFEKTRADRLRWNMGQMPNRYFDLDYTKLCVNVCDRIIAAESHNARTIKFIRDPRFPVRFEEKLQYEYEIQQAEQLLSEIELAYTWGYLPFQLIERCE